MRCQHERRKMNRYMIKIPVLIGVLVFIFLQTGCREKDGLALELFQYGSEAVPAAEAESAAAETVAAAENVAWAETVTSAVTEAQLPVDSEPAEFAVHICGAVQKPGVYRLAEGSRICDAIQMAGGLSSDASDRSINQAALIADGMQIMIPTVEEAAQRQNVSAGTAVSGTVADGGSGPVDLNSATLAELMTLPGIGETRAEAILAYREKNGGFSSIEDIMQVNGIKEGSFEKLREYITVR